MVQKQTADGSQDGRQGETQNADTETSPVEERARLQQEMILKAQARKEFAQARWEDQLNMLGPDRGQAVTPAALDTQEAPSLPPLNNEFDQLLYGEPTMRPQEPITAGVSRVRPNAAPPPPEINRMLKGLMTLAQDPNAPEQVHQLVAAITRELEGS